LEKRARHRRPLLFAAGNFGCAPVEVRAQTQVREQKSRSLFVRPGKVKERLPPGITAEPAAEDVAQDAGVLREQEILENDPDAFLVIGRLMQTAGVAGKSDSALGRLHHAGQAIEQARFTYAGRSHHGHDTSARHLPIEMAEEPAPIAFQAQPLDGKVRERRRGRW
jgi:hypothetical protein